MPFCKLNLEQNKNEVTIILINKVNETTYLMDTSFPSQHRPGHHASGPTAHAKSGLWDDENFEDESTSSWDD